METIKEIIEGAYLDYVNNYLTISKYAEDKEISMEMATFLILEGEKINNKRIK